MAIAAGPEAASEQMGIPRTTILYWLDKPEFVALRQKTSSDVAEQMWVAVQTGVQRVVDLIPSTEDIGKVATAVGILYDKHALLTGSATSRSEHRDIGDADTTGIDTLEGVLAGRPWEVPAGVVAGSNGAKSNGRH